jgi:hypothetical protein
MNVVLYKSSPVFDHLSFFKREELGVGKIT